MRGARQDLERFAKERGLRIAATYVEQVSGATLARPELFQLLVDAGEGDVLLVEDDEDRRRRQKQGIASAKASGRYKGRPDDLARNASIARMLEAKVPWSQIVIATKASRSAISRIAKRNISNTNDEIRVRNS